MENAARLLPASLKRRLALGIGACVTLLWLVAAGLGGWHLREEIDEISDSALQEVVQRVLPLAYTEVLGREAGDAKPDVVAPVGPHREYITYVVRDQGGKVLLQSHDAVPGMFPAVLHPGFQDGPGTRFYTEAGVRGTLFVTAAERPGHRNTAIRQAILALLWPLALLLPLVLLATWWLVDRAFRPVLALGEAIGARGGANLNPVPAEGLPPEIRPVGAAVNALLGRLRRAMEAERSFTANSAHELRTPVAGALAQVQRLVTELPEGAGRQRARDIETSLRRLARLSEKLLQLAKAEGGALLAHEAQDLTPVLAIVLQDLGAGARIDYQPGGSVMSRLDIDAFAILARNLIENALKHGDAAFPVQVSLTQDGLFRVANRGAVIGAQARAALLERFSRGATQAEGTGLGLSIAAAIAQGIGAELMLLSPAPDLPDGVELRVQLPLAG